MLYIVPPAISELSFELVKLLLNVEFEIVKELLLNITPPEVVVFITPDEPLPLKVELSIVIVPEL